LASIVEVDWVFLDAGRELGLKTESPARLAKSHAGTVDRAMQAGRSGSAWLPIGAVELSKNDDLHLV